LEEGFIYRYKCGDFFLKENIKEIVVVVTTGEWAETWGGKSNCDGGL
jgi:hypothetical protein